MNAFIPSYSSKGPNRPAATNPICQKERRRIRLDSQPWKTRSRYCRSSHTKCENLEPGLRGFRWKCGWHGDDLKTCGKYIHRCEDCLLHGAEGREE